MGSSHLDTPDVATDYHYSLNLKFFLALLLNKLITKNFPGFMELIEIIFDLLVLGGALLLIVILVSYLMSRNNNKNRKIGPETAIRPSSVIKNPAARKEQSDYRNNPIVNRPMIFEVDQSKSRELKIVRKYSLSDREDQQNIPRSKKTGSGKPGPTGSRYTIINEEIIKNKSRMAVNFFNGFISYLFSLHL